MENNKADMVEKDDLIMWDAINGDFYEHDSLDSVLKDLKENYTDPEEGIHPEALNYYSTYKRSF